MSQYFEQLRLLPDQEVQQDMLPLIIGAACCHYSGSIYYDYRDIYYNMNMIILCWVFVETLMS